MLNVKCQGLTDHLAILNILFLPVYLEESGA